MTEGSLRTGLSIGDGPEGAKFAVSAGHSGPAGASGNPMCVKYYTFQASQNEAAVNAAHKVYFIYRVIHF